MTIGNIPPSGLICPLCSGNLSTWARKNLQVEFCDACSALFLDRGELFDLFRSEGYNCPPEAILRGGFVEVDGPALTCPKCLKTTLTPGNVQGADMWHCTPCNGFLVERELLLGEASAHDVPLDLKGFRKLSGRKGEAGQANEEGVVGRLVSWARGLVGVVVVPLALQACGPPPDAASSSAEAVATADPDAVPTFEVDPSWPQDMSNLWILGAVTAVFVDARDHVWVAHLPETLTPEETSAVQDPPIGTCCVPAPVVVEFDPAGRVVQGWGDATQDVSEFPRNPHGLFVDHNDFVWVGTYRHHRVMKFTREGQLVMTIGEYDHTEGSSDTELLGGPAGIWVDPTTNEVFIADGYTNRRVVVFDGETGAYLRHWGAYGEPPNDTYDYGDRDPDGPPPEQFSTVHGLMGSGDGLIYVADRRGNRIQVFRQDGEFVAEKIIAPRTLASGSAFVVALSPDPEQRWLYLADGTNHKVWTLRRSDLEVVGEFGRGGRQVGQFLRPHGMSIDSHGNLYVGEASTGRRVQKFAVRAGG